MTSRHTDRYADEPTGTPRAPDASMNLLNQVMSRPLDPGYAAAARRKARYGTRPRTVVWTMRVTVLAVVLGFLTAAAAATLRAPQPAALAARTLLEKEITERSDAAAARRAANDALNEQVKVLQSAALAASDPGLLAQLGADELATGATAVVGPGVRVTLADAPTAASSDDLDLRVQDGDVQDLVNGLWAAGAEAVSVNGHRLTALSAIRSAGGTILVDFSPLSGPYVIEAIGDPATMPARLARADAGQHLSMLRNTFGLKAEVSTTDRLKLTASGAKSLAIATPKGTAQDDGTGAASPSSSGVASSDTTKQGGHR